jgi:hypothetical protein
MCEQNQISPASTTAIGLASFSRSSTAADEVAHHLNPPFQRDQQLCKELEYSRESGQSSCLRTYGSSQTLPDAPRVRLDCSTKLSEYCLSDLDTPEMNRLGEKLWWAGPTPDVVSLTQHVVLERRVQVTEDPSVHLLWTEGVIYVKPLPAYLTSYAFWEYILDCSNSNSNLEERKRLKATSLGFLKTYAALIRRRSDFNLARQHDLLASFSDLTFEAFVTFISAFDNIPSSTISSRWRYGIIQLDALNFHSALHLRRWHLNRFESRYGAYFSRFFPVILFIFAVFSVMLSAMQVILAARQMWDTDDKGLKKVLGLFVWFGTEAIGWSLAFSLLFVIWWIGISGVEAWGRKKMQRKVRRMLREDKVTRP